MNKKVIAIIIVTIVLVLGLLLLGNPNRNMSSDSSSDLVIIANPLNLSQIESLSKFRSCVGHDFSGKNSNGETETLRSMKHYIDYKKTLKPSEVKIFAPFDGEIRAADNSTPGQQVYISASAAPSWSFIFFHVNLLSELTEGSSVQAGQHIGYVDTGAIANFDMVMRRFGFGGQITDSPFYHMNDDVLAQYEAVGITLANIIVTKEARDAEPCPIVPGTESKRDTIFPSGDQSEDWTTLTISL